MKLDVVVPTYNRSRLLQGTIASLFRASVPEGLKVRLIVVDNNSADDTALVVAKLQADAPFPLTFIHEPKQNSSCARNAGILAGDGDLIGFVDDDEEIGPDWYTVILREFTDPETSFIGGPYLPRWVTPEPDWLPPGYHAAIGAVPPKPRAVFDETFTGNLMGGNAVLRRQVFDRVGLYATHLGRSNKGLLCEEDAEFCRRLQAAGVRGMYVPDLTISHYIAPERLTRNYHRRWAYWRAVSQGVDHRDRREPAPQIFGVPPHRIGRALRSLLAIPKHRIAQKDKARAFADELATWDLVGFIYGRHFVRVKQLYADHG